MSSLLLQQQIIFDSCVYIMDNQKNGNVIDILNKKLRKYRLKTVIPDVILYEIFKITKISKEKTSHRIDKRFNGFITVSTTNEIKSEAKLLEEKYYECHHPDSIILATAKILGTIFVTLDCKLLRTAQLEGVDAYHLSDFMKYWRIQN